jgi:hypothetical protein
MRRTRPDVEQQATAMYQEGLTGREGGARLGISDVTVYNILARQRISRRPGGKPGWGDTEENRREIVAAESIRTLAKRYRTRAQTVMAVL